jgi:hypothetical protein
MTGESIMKKAQRGGRIVTPSYREAMKSEGVRREKE